MSKRWFLAALLAVGVACSSSGKNRENEEAEIMTGEKRLAGPAGRDAVERALASLGFEGRILRIDLNEGRSEKSRMRIGQMHLLENLLLLETEDDKPRVFALERTILEPRWVSSILESSKYPVSQNDDTVVMVSAHYAHVLELMSGRRALQFVGGDLDGLRKPYLELPFSPTAGAAVGIDTMYIPSLGNPRNNKNIEAFSLVNGQRGWGKRASSGVMTTPVVSGEKGDPKLYYVTTSGLVSSFDATNYGYAPPAPAWEELLNTGADFGLKVTRDTRNAVGGVFVVDNDGVVYCLNRITGERRWATATGRKPAGKPMVFGDVCVVATKSGFIGFDVQGPIYDLVVAGGPDRGKTFTIRGLGAKTLGSGARADWGVSDSTVGDAALSFEMQGEVLVMNAPDEETSVVVNDVKTANANLRDGMRIEIGRTVLTVRDRSAEPLWKDLDVDVVLGRIGSTLLCGKEGGWIVKVDAETGRRMGDPVKVPGIRIATNNTFDANLYLIGGDAIVYGLFPR